MNINKQQLFNNLKSPSNFIEGGYHINAVKKTIDNLIKYCGEDESVYVSYLNHSDCDKMMREMSITDYNILCNVIREYLGGINDHFDSTGEFKMEDFIINDCKTRMMNLSDTIYNRVETLSYLKSHFNHYKGEYLIVKIVRKNFRDINNKECGIRTIDDTMNEAMWITDIINLHKSQ